MTEEQIQKNEAEYAGFVDQGTRVVLQDAIQKVVETFSQTDDLEDILSYLESMRDLMQTTDDRIKEIQQREKQISEKVNMAETSVRNLLQRVQEMEVKIAAATDKVEHFTEHMVKLTKFFELPPLKRMFGRLESEEEAAAAQEAAAQEEKKSE